MIRLHEIMPVALGACGTFVLFLLSFAFVPDLYAANDVRQEGLSGAELAQRVGFGLGVLSLALILFVLVYHRRNLFSQAARWLHFLSLCVIPVFILFLGNLVAYDGSKQTAFCGACHPVMGPYVDDLFDPTSSSLAAIHNQNRYIQKNKCYSCHVGYGIAGNLEAKIDGLQHMARFLYRHYTGTFQEPIKLIRPYNNANCLRCHAGAKKFEGIGIHAGMMSQIKTNKASCLNCHAKPHFQPAAKSGK
jgi:nitrate/TMAO reductase-like tetraheme cytochrome c subunit